MEFRPWLMACVGMVLSLEIAQGVAAPIQHDADTTASVEDLSPPSLGREYLRILVRYPGVYKMSANDIRNAGIDPALIPLQKITMWNEGRKIPFRIKNSAEAFTSATVLEFAGSPPRGTESYFKPYNRHNVYFMTWDGSDTPLRYKKRESVPSSQTVSSIRINRRFEHDMQLPIHVPGATEFTDGFFWHYIQPSPEGTTIPDCLDLSDADLGASHPIELRLRVFGLTNVASTVPGHEFDVLYGNNQYPLGSIRFTGLQGYDLITSLPASEVLAGPQPLLIRAPSHRLSTVDRIVLDYIETTYTAQLRSNPHDFVNYNVAGESGAARVVGRQPGARLYDEAQACYWESEVAGETFNVDYSGTSILSIMQASEAFPVDTIEAARSGNGSQLTRPALNTEVLLLFHPTLGTAARYYTEWRKSRGLCVHAADVQQVFDVLNHGFASDQTLKRYVRFIAQRCPQLKYVVLLGDSTSDYREARSVDQELRPDVLVPTHWVNSPGTAWTGGYLDDNYYGSFSARYRPTVAVGRIPAHTEQQAMEYIRKLVAYEALSKSQNDQALVVSSVEKSFQELATSIQTRYADQFSTVGLLFPETAEADREVSRLRAAFDSGTQLLYYIGHGGALVWRVGPTDFQKQKDLFTPAEVRKLKNRNHYPIITCSSCYTTSFDLDESLGEALIFAPESGAIAVIGTPWKSTVYEDHNFNQKLLEAYIESKHTRLGDAFLSAKLATAYGGESAASQAFILLGDPCLEIQRKAN